MEDYQNNITRFNN